MSGVPHWSPSLMAAIFAGVGLENAIIKSSLSISPCKKSSFQAQQANCAVGIRVASAACFTFLATTC